MMAPIREGSRSEWQRAAACRGLDPDLFFPATDSEEDRAKVICSACAVRIPCLEFAMRAGERYGIWGGTSGDDRRVLGTTSHQRKAMGAPTQ